MQIVINSVNFGIDAALETFIREKVNKLFNQDNRIIRANVILHEEKDGIPENKLCEIRLMVPGNDHFVRKCSGVFQKSVLQAVEVLQKVLRIKKSKLIAKRRHL